MFLGIWVKNSGIFAGLSAFCGFASRFPRKKTSWFLLPRFFTETGEFLFTESINYSGHSFFMRKSAYKHVGRYAWTLVGSFLIIIVSVVGWDIYRDYLRKYNSLMLESQSQVRIIAEHASRTIGEVDRSIDNVLRDMSMLGGLPASSEKALHDIFVANQQEIPQIISFFVADDKGTLKASSLKYPIEKINLREREFFAVHRDAADDSPFISRPYRNRSTGKWVFAITQRISNHDGSFAGVIGASCDPSYFESLYATLFKSSSRRVSLVREDGYLIVDTLAEDSDLDINIKNGRMFTEYLPKSPIGSYRNTRASEDNSDRLVAYSRVPGIYPLIARLSFNWHELFSDWRREAIARTMLTVLFTVTFLILTTVLARKLRELAISDMKVFQLSLAVEQSPVSVVITDTDGTITYVNPKFSQITGYSYDESLGQNPKILKTLLTPPETHAELWTSLSSGKEWRGEFCNKKKNGDYYWEMASISPVVNTKGETTHFVAVKEDITARKNAEIQLKEQSLKDDLTSLYNRRGFMLLAQQQIKLSDRDNRGFILVYADVDSLKEINDTFGHGEGDRAICDTADVLRSSFRASDIIGRFGGDEFGVIYVEKAEQSEELVMERLLEKLAAHNLEANRTYKLSISFGFIRYNPNECRTLEDLLQQADRRMYEQKANKRT
jgi:diguanylate cyclase (GGDEF)-like protein/PAS domain S-box-containing protein